MSNKIQLTINGQKIKVKPKTTILQAAEKLGLTIPTFCYQEYLRPIGKCRLCVVEIQGKDRLVTSCVAKVKEGMIVETNSERVRQARRNRIELILSKHYGDCVAPCQLACPANLDIQGYIALLVNGQYLEALKLVKERCPMPLVIGRICPGPCEVECRRQKIDAPVCIKFLKHFLGDFERNNYKKLIVCLPKSSGYKVAVVGGGPAGLSVAYYLRLKGHEVTIFESMPKLGGKLRYGVPSFRLPNHILDLEVESILQLGIETKINSALGKDFTCKDLFYDGYTAVFLGIGCWGERNLRIPGEKLSNVIAGSTFLSDVSLGKNINIGDKIIVVGGGNTAIDAARTALRFGAKKVDIYYRRSRVEMPALNSEIDAAEEEGIVINLLVSPSRLLGENGKLKAMEYIHMELSEKASQGRRRPIPIAGSEQIVEVDTIISAIGQLPVLDELENDELCQKIETTRFGTLVVNFNTLQTNLVGIFTGGDIVTGPKTLISALAAGRCAAHSIDLFLRKKPVKSTKMPFNISKGSLDKVDIKNFAGIYNKPKIKMPKLTALERYNNFKEVDLGFSEEIAVKAANRCLSCGCIDAFECKLREYATEYGINISDIEVCQEKNFEIVKTHPYIIVDPNKCINCRRCMRNCSEYQCSDAITLEALQYDPKGKISFYGPVINNKCISCGLCVSNCPTGALVEKTNKHPGPFLLETISTTCSYCGCGCNLILNYIGNDLVKVTSNLKNRPNYGHLCINGKFRYKAANGRKRINKPLIKQKNQFIPVEWDKAISYVAQRFQMLQKTYGSESFAGIATSNCTNEEAYIFQKFLRSVIKTPHIDFLENPWAIDIPHDFIALLSPTADYRTIENMQQLLITSDNPAHRYPIIDALVRRAQRKNKAKVVFVNDNLPDISENFSTAFIYSKEIFQWNINQLEQILSMSKQGVLHLIPLLFKSNGLGLLNMGVVPNLFPGQKAINDIEEHKKFENVWETNLPEQVGLSIDKILEKIFIEDLRVIYFMGDIDEDTEYDDKLKKSLEKAEFLVAQTSYHSNLLSAAEVILPQLPLEETEGTITNIEGRISSLAFPNTMKGLNKPGKEIITNIANLMGYPMLLNSIDEITKEIN